MTKQEEIREGIAKIEVGDVFDMEGNKLMQSFVSVGGKGADKILSYLHSQRVVIKVKCPDCEWSQFGDEVVGMTPCDSCNSTGYVTEPLIKKHKYSLQELGGRVPLSYEELRGE